MNKEYDKGLSDVRLFNKETGEEVFIGEAIVDIDTVNRDININISASKRELAELFEIDEDDILDVQNVDTGYFIEDKDTIYYASNEDIIDTRNAEKGE